MMDSILKLNDENYSLELQRNGNVEDVDLDDITIDFDGIEINSKSLLVNFFNPIPPVVPESNANPRLISIVPECPKVLPKDNISHLKQDSDETDVKISTIENESAISSKNISVENSSIKDTLFGWQSSLAE